jgi:hypothetical protein
MSFVKSILEFLGLLGFGTLLGILINHFFSIELKKAETKLVLFRRLYKQLNLLVLLRGEEIELLEPKTGIEISKTLVKIGLIADKELGEILIYIDGELENKIFKLISTIYQDSCVFGKSDLDNVVAIMELLKKEINIISLPIKIV